MYIEFIYGWFGALTPELICEWVGALIGLAGAYILAVDRPYSYLGWRYFLAANVAMILFALAGHHWGVLTQQVGFTATSILGIYRASKRAC